MRHDLLSALPTDLAERLFASARAARLTAGRALFAAGDPGEWVLIELTSAASSSASAIRRS